MGFIHDIKKVLAVLPQKKQSLLFSATFSDEIKALADRLLNKPALIEVARRNQTAELIAQKVHPVGREHEEGPAGAPRSRSNDWHQVLVFTRMKHGANRLAEHLLKHGITRDGDPRQQEPDARAPRRSPTSRAATCRCWSRPTSPRAASTSTSCRTSSTSSCRTCPRTTCTASAAPAAPARRARRSRWSASTRTASCATSSG